MYLCTRYMYDSYLCTRALSDFRAEFLVVTILILIIEDVQVLHSCTHVYCSPKSPLFEYKTDIILRNRQCHRFITFTVVYFTFCFRKKIFFQSSRVQYNIHVLDVEVFFGNIFYVFLIFFKIDPKYFPQCRSCRINRVFHRLP